MNRSLPALLAAAGLAAGIAHAGPYDQPWAVIASEDRSSTDPALRPVVISRVDGEPAYRNQFVTTPGTRSVTVGLPPRAGLKVGAQETFDLQASPCMRYFIAAKPDTPAGESWKAVVRRSELIGECATKFRSEAPSR